MSHRFAFACALLAGALVSAPSAAAPEGGGDAGHHHGAARPDAHAPTALGTVRLGTNANGYRLGNGYEVTPWLGRRWNAWLSTSLRLDWRDWKNIHGDDDALNPAVVPTADPDLRAGRRLDALVGINRIVPRGPLRGNRFAVEMGWPLYQSLRGPQLETDWVITAGWQLTF